MRPSQIRTWLGDSRGRCEGNTLVVETTNFHPDRIWRGATGDMHLVERFTRVDRDTISYQITVTDPDDLDAALDGRDSLAAD